MWLLYTYAAWLYIYIYVYEYVCIIYALATLSFELKFFISKSLLSCTVLGMIAEWKVDEWNNERINERMNEVEGLNINWVILMTYNALIIVDWSGRLPILLCVVTLIFFGVSVWTLFSLIWEAFTDQLRSSCFSILKICIIHTSQILIHFTHENSTIMLTIVFWEPLEVGALYLLANELQCKQSYFGELKLMFMT